MQSPEVPGAERIGGSPTDAVRSTTDNALQWRPRRIETPLWRPVVVPVAADPAPGPDHDACQALDGRQRDSRGRSRPDPRDPAVVRAVQLDDPLNLPEVRDAPPTTDAGSDDQPGPAAEGVDASPPAETHPNLLDTPTDDDSSNGPPSPAPLEGATRGPSETREDPADECRVAERMLHQNRLDKISLDIGLRGKAGDDFPVDCGLGDDPFQPRTWAETLYTWKASALCHKPLYFEEEAVERYGHSKGPFLQPLYSGARFFATLPILPYKMGLEPPCECVYVLGHYRPGSCAPYLIPPVPISARAALLEAGAVVGAAAIFP
ncbi:MAG: hypothetical protein A2W31_14665 [Planctomycetes bacterium RBG_16_64_10]|nr:MAG: hypothetical protein A2W31_14665 [Planctomycetes bacterium RBG_16_64_10]